MPTYVCHAQAGRLTPDQKARVAKAITAAHSEEMAGPRYLVQVLFQEFKPADVFIGGAPASENQIWIYGNVRSGRTDAQRQALQTRIAAEVGEIAGSAQDDMWVYINELLPINMVEFGHILPLPGREAEWLGALPERLRKHLTQLETR
jgi:phenylpyruvate tautomerase PptA (4-oxalocrotonate tautomerase family)